MARQNINIGTTANDGTGDTLRVAGQKLNDNFVEIYTILGDSDGLTDNVSLVDSGVQYNGLLNNTVLGFVEGPAKTTILLPDSSGTITLNTATQTLTNKTITSPVLTTPQINDTSANHQYVVAVSELTADRVISLPLLTGDDEFVFKDQVQTITNKTFTTPNFTSPTIQTEINDVNGATLIKIAPSASAVNELQFSNAATGGIPQVAGTGADSDVGLGLSGSGSGLVHIQTGVRYKGEVIAATGTAISQKVALTVFEAGGPISVTLADGTYIGEQKTLASIGNGEVTVTPNTFKNGSTLHLRTTALVNCMWVDATEGWLLMSPKTYDSSDADALFYVTA